MTPPQQTGSGLIERAQAGDRRAFDELGTRLRPRLAEFIRRRLRPPLENRVEVDDILQETFLRGFQRLAQLKWVDEESLLRWLCGIAANVVCEQASHHRRRAAAPLAGDVAGADPSTSKTLQREERFDRLKAALAGLASDHREVILLCRIQKLPLKEVARKLDRSPQATSQLLWRALKKLRESFGDTESFHLPNLALDAGEDHGREVR